MMGNIVFVIYRPARQVLAAGMRTTVTGGGGTGAVDSVNGQTGVVVLDADDIAEGATNHYYPQADETKLAGIETGAQVNVGTNISVGYNPAYVFVNSSTGTDATLAGATDTAAGVMSAADKVKLDGIATGATQNSSDAFLLTRGNHTGTQSASTISDFASASRAQTEAELVAGTNVTITPSGSGATRQLTIAAAGGGGATNLSTTTSTTTLTVNSDTGTDAVLPAATGSVAGVLTAADKTKIDGIATGATANANTDSLSEGPTNKYFTELRVLATLMAGFTLVAGGTVLAADSLLVAVGKLQKQINDLFSGKQDTLVSGTNIKTVNGASLLGAGDIAIAGGGSLPVVQTFVGAKSLALTDINTYNVSQDATAQAVTLPAQATVAWPDDAEIHLERGAAGALTVVGAAGVQINGTVAGTFTLGAQYSVVTLKRKAANLWTLFGNAS